MSLRPALLMMLVLFGCGSTGVGNPPTAPDDTKRAPNPPGVPRDRDDPIGPVDPGDPRDPGDPPPLSSRTSLSLTGVDDALTPRRTRYLPPGSVHTAVLHVSELTAVPCDMGEPIQRLPGPFDIDLKAVESFKLPDLSNTESGMCALRLGLSPGGADDLYPGESVHLDAAYADYRISIAMPTKFDIVLRTRADAAWGLTNDEAIRSAIIALRPERWLRQREVFTRLGFAGELIVDERRPALLTEVRLRMRLSTTLHADLDGDGRLDLLERIADAILALGER